MMKDEGPFVIEWVAHHLAVGFTDLVVYTNDCSDGTDDMLIRLEELGLAHHRRNVIPEGLRPQPSALNYAEAEPVVCGSDWVMVFDADEFLSIRHGDGTLDDLIASAKERGANGVVITWRIFGSGNVVAWSRAPVSEQYLMAAPPDWNKGWGVKTLFKYDPEYWKLGIHRPKLKAKHVKTDFPDTIRWINGSGQEMPEYFKFRGWRSIVRTVGYDWAQLNHYAVKSVDSYALRKLRGNVNNKKDKYNSDYWSLQDRNEVRDETMLRYTARRNAIIEQLLSDPVLNRLHYAAVGRAEARLDEIRQTPAYTELVEGLAKAGQVSIGNVVAKPPQARDPAKIAAQMSEVEKARNDRARAARKAGSDPDAAPPPALPSETYVANAAPTPGYSGEWVGNHEILLPADAGVFTTPSLAALAKGKFQRGLARRLPMVLKKGANLLEIGAGCGFLGAHLARVRPDLRLHLQEDSPGLRQAMQLIWARNGRDADRVLQNWSLPGPQGSPDDWPAPLAADVLMLGDARITPAMLAQLLARQHPAQILLYGPLLETNRAQLADYERLLSAGYAAEPGFDSALTLFWVRK
ncbi:glycosyltransferase family 2 protein [Xinfangfangia sp. D13-10-4-6]|nr:glycosyltransferase family 2 protein [Pseudogemmobacter hezensis]